MQTLTLHRILEALRFEWQNSTPGFVSLLQRGNQNIKYFIFLVWELNPQPVSYSRTLMTQRQDCAQVIIL